MPEHPISRRLFCLLVAAAPCSVVAAADPPKSPEIRVQPGKAPASEGSLVRIPLEVHNPNRTPVPYSGYLPSSYEGGLPKGRISPLYRVELRRNGRWEPFMMGWCGTGRGPVQIEAKERVTFEAHVPAGDWEAVRVGLTWWAGERTADEPQVAWSPAVTRPL